ncbi:MAG: hypothetical protein V1724_07175 [Chloroflexota bacterium]
MTLFSEAFGIHHTQSELDFVNVPIDGDIPLFIDPFAISQRVDRWSHDCHLTLIDFFDRAVQMVRSGNSGQALSLLQHLREPNETRFGLSVAHPRGAGVGRIQAEQLLDALTQSSAVRTGFISSLEECELLIDGIGRDKISDLTTNIVRSHLAEYTKDQCLLHGLATRAVALGPTYSPSSHQWESQYFDLPVAGGRPVLLVPKAIARYDPAYDHQKYYRDFVLNYLQAEHLESGSSLVHALKNGRQVVYKKDLKALLPCTKENLFRFSRGHPEVLAHYREHLERLERAGASSLVEEEDEKLIAEELAAALTSVHPGGDSATDYHSLMVGIVEFLFFPGLLYPKKEREIHQGRKRIDIVMENGARGGIFEELHSVRGYPCAFVMFECKNYATEVANPELDQLAGRFSPNRGKVGFLCCRSFEDRARFIERCRDTFRDDRGLIVPLEDSTVIQLLKLLAEGRRNDVGRVVAELINEIWFS